MLEIDAVNQHEREVELEPLKTAVARILADAGVTSGSVNIAVVDDPTIHDLNRRHLDHDYPTDVLSYLLDREGDSLDGEIAVSLDTAEREAANWDWDSRLELLLYVVHGALHLVGYDDHSEDDRKAMLAKERHYFEQWGEPLPPGRDPTSAGRTEEGSYDA